MSFKAYDEYKDSGVEWLGKVPAHWPVSRLKNSTVSCQNGVWGDDPQDDINDVICVRVADFDRSSMTVDISNPTYRNIRDSDLESRLVEKGDLLLEKSGGGEKQPVGFVCLYEHEAKAICANFIARIKLAEHMSPSFWRYVHAAGYSIGLNIASIKQTSGIQNLDQHSYLNESAAYPTFKEQTTIAAFLDHETARIDALIEEQQRLIALLKEKRQAVISHAVTKGLDPNVPMKDSGVEWLGEVPAHWGVVPIKFIVSTPVTDGPHETPTFIDDGVKFISAEAISSGEINFDKAKFISIEDHKRFSRKYHPNKLDIFMVKSGATTGKVAINTTDIEFNIWSPLAVIRCKNENDPYFVFRFIQSDSFQKSVTLSWNYGTQQNIGMGVIENLPITAPPIDEQKSISKFISREVEALDKLSGEADKTAFLLQERRSALISAAVTGKIDVRDWQPPKASHTSTEPAEANA